MKFQKGNKINLGRWQSEETRRKISEAQKGRKLSEEHKRKTSETMKGKKPYQMTDEIRKKISQSLKGTKHVGSFTSEKMKGNVPWNKGKPGFKQSEETKLKKSMAMRGKRVGEKSSNWKGGITPINERIRRSLEYKLWRTAVFKRDNYTCIWCGVVGGRLNADHIKPFSQYPELRFAIDNGRTLCVKCHETTETYGGRMNKYIKL
jgi:hypothetical protein